MVVIAEDINWGAFTDDGPWVVDQDTLLWYPIAGLLRQAARADVPALTRPRRIPPGLRVITVAGRLIGAIGPWWLRKKFHRYATPEAGRSDISARLRRAVERLGPTYIKLGQIISSGEGLFPAELVSEFKQCRDQVPAEPFDTVRTVVEDDLGVPLEHIFSSFDTSPLAAASIAQVHAATLRTGERVVVKVQRPSVTRLVRKDLRVMAWLAPHLVGRIPIASLANPPALVELFAETIVEELDFRMEAANMIDIAVMLHELKQTGYVVPRPHPTLITRRVLVMERIDGFNFDDVAGMKDAGVDTEAVVRTAMIALIEGALVYGVFHGDLHGGNLFVLPDGRTALLDFGIVGRLSGDRRLAFLRMMVCATTNDVRGQLEAMRDLGALPADTDLDAVIRDLAARSGPGRPHDADRGGVDRRGSASGQGVARVRGTNAQRADALREEHGLPRRGNGQAGPGSRPARPRSPTSRCCSPNVTGRSSAASSESTMRSLELNMDGVKAGFGVDPSTQQLTYRELQSRRALIQKRMRDHVGR